jgi:hypothetical protein
MKWVDTNHHNEQKNRNSRRGVSPCHQALTHQNTKLSSNTFTKN